MGAISLVEELKDPEFRRVYVCDLARLSVAHAIRSQRQKFGLTAAELGELCGKPQSVISRLENPDGPAPSTTTIAEVASAMGLAVHVVLKPLPGARP